MLNVKLKKVLKHRINIVSIRVEATLIHRIKIFLVERDTFFPTPIIFELSFLRLPRLDKKNIILKMYKKRSIDNEKRQ
jgi:hypothetical protein